jgi:hypothetical protein
LQTPDAQLAPFATGLHEEAVIPGSHVSHGFAGLSAPDAYMTPAMAHRLPQTPPEQT